MEHLKKWWWAYLAGFLILVLIIYFAFKGKSSGSSGGGGNAGGGNMGTSGGNTGGTGGGSGGGTGGSTSQILKTYPCETKKVCQGRVGYANWVKTGTQKKCNASNISQGLCLSDCKGTCYTWE